MTDEDQIAIRKALASAKELVNSAQEKIKEIEAIAKRNGEARYLAYDMEDASYGLRRLASDLGQSAENFEHDLECGEL